jgi:3-oxoacyl-[acyl-carrier protein] reductase
MVRPVFFDMLDKDAMKRFMRELISSKTRIDILVNNAGAVAESSSFLMTPISRMREVFEVNFFAQMALTQYVVRIMSRTNGGCVVNVASTAGMDGNPAQLEYAASKAAMIGATKKLADELSPQNIRVNAVAPGPTDTGMAGKMDAAVMEAALGRGVMKRMGRPEEIAGVILFLASELSSFMTGQVIRADGGM